MTERDEIDLGDNHTMIFSEYQGEKRVGANIVHQAADGSKCQGWISFEGRAWANSFNGSIATWKVEQDEPITLSPSIACRVCGDHGYVRDGKWVKA
jgi:hypothetical protein